jgi:hypothetical protein
MVGETVAVAVAISQATPELIGSPPSARMRPILRRARAEEGQDMVTMPRQPGQPAEVSLRGASWRRHDIGHKRAMLPLRAMAFAIPPGFHYNPMEERC